jgi:ABC-type polysaccharide/polyol phosphate transport system ATPase subunit
MITGALYPPEGSFRVTGRVLSLIELGTGLHPLMTGRANIINAARLLGFPVDYARSHIEEIEAFADIAEFFDREVRVYSTGMRVRLAFAMFACFRPEVFLVDEALSVGDVFFQQKCSVRLRELLDGGMTMLFVSHDQGAVLNLCDRAVLLDHGRPAFDGEPAEALARYTASLRGWTRSGAWKKGGAGAGERNSAPERAPSVSDRDSERAAATIRPSDQSGASPDSLLANSILPEDLSQRFGAGDVRVLGVRVTDARGRDVLHANMGEELVVHVLVEAARPVEQPRVGIKLLDRFTNLLFACGTRMLGYDLPPMAPGDRVVVTLRVTMDLAPGQYSLAVGASTPQPGDPEAGVVQDEIGDLGPIRVLLDRTRPRPFFGAARLPVSASHAVVSGAAAGAAT